MKKVIEVDNNGFFIKDVFLTNEEEIPYDCIDILIPTEIRGFYRPKWTGTEWIEDMTQDEIDGLNSPTKEQEVVTAKRQLEETDYKMIKSSEYQLLGLEIPYNLEELHIERQTLRDKINDLENL